MSTTQLLKNMNVEMYNVTAKHIEGTQLCSIELPCKYKGKDLTVMVCERIDTP